MIEPTPGGVVRASAEPARQEPAEQIQETTFERALERQQAARARAKAAQTERKDDVLTAPADALDPTSRAAAELASAAPPKATTQAALQEQQASSRDQSEPPARTGQAAPKPSAQPQTDPQPRSAPSAPQTSSPPTATAQPDLVASPTPVDSAAAKTPAESTSAQQPQPQAVAPVPAAKTVASTIATSQPSAPTRADSTTNQTTASSREATPAANLKTLREPSTCKPAAERAPRHEAPEAQFSRGLAAALRQGGGSVTIRLSPEDLGDLSIRLQIHGASVEARFEAATDQARGLLNDSIDALRAALEARGLEVDRLSVHVAERQQHDPQDAAPRDAGNQGQGHGRHEPQQQDAGHGSPRHAARTPNHDPGTELLVIPEAMADAVAGLGGALRLDAIA